jgi:hypothetical protein
MAKSSCANSGKAVYKRVYRHRGTLVIDGIAVFRMDPKIGPVHVYRSANIKQISHEEVLAIFATHNLFAEGFRGVHTGISTWATYVWPPWIIALRLSADEPIGPIGAPMAKTVRQFRLDKEPSNTQWEALYQAMTQELKKSPVVDLLTSTAVGDFLRKLRSQGITSFTPVFNFAIGPVYPAADQLTGTNSYDTRLFLEKLTLAGLFTPEAFAGITQCPRCHGFKVMSRLACPKCSTTALEVVRIDVAGETEVSAHPEGTVPNHPYYSCLTCNHTTDEPLLTFLCTECGSQFQPYEAEYRTMNRLLLDEKKAAALLRQIDRQGPS